ncbi:MAG: DUF4418 family protein [Clostridia bacterium]|nr:DUF4418 family protein [Clostridia bacterium]MBQ2326869.1 DUF4418 family protein [Clostridia bacterium]MBQ5813844.1 DUF4418 family protein [Clostridia bacterium]
MKNKYVIGIALILLGALIAFGPQSIFSVCEFNPEKAMKCHWMAKAEMGVGLVILAEGILSMVFDDKNLRLGLCISALLLGVLTLALPHVLIGVCKNAHMPCVTLTRPALTICGIAVVLMSGLSAFSLKK